MVPVQPCHGSTRTMLRGGMHSLGLCCCLPLASKRNELTSPRDYPSSADQGGLTLLPHSSLTTVGMWEGVCLL